MDESTLLALLDQFELLGTAWHGHPARRAEAATKAPQFPRGKHNAALREWARELAFEAQRRGINSRPFADVAANATWFSDPDLRRSIEQLRAILRAAVPASVATLAGPEVPGGDSHGDDGNYVLVTHLSGWQSHFPTYKRLRSFLASEASIRSRPRGANRFEVHAADWLRFCALKEKERFDQLDGVAQAIDQQSPKRGPTSAK